MAELQSDDRIAGFIEEHPGWERKGDSLEAEFGFEDFNEAMGFVTRVGLKAERLFHHPDIAISWNQVRLTLSTHSEGGITDLDLELAAFCDQAG